jgi:hypothetical protein
MRLEAVWNEAHINGDAAALDRLWHEPDWPAIHDI